MSTSDLLIVHLGTGTILRAGECLLVDPAGFAKEDLARLSDDEYFDDGVICEIAERCGVAVDIHEQTLKLIAGAIAEHCDPYQRHFRRRTSRHCLRTFRRGRSQRWRRCAY